MFRSDGSHRHLASQARDLPALTPNAALRWDVISRMLPEEPGNMLEIGCGRGAVAARLARVAKSLVAIEPDAESCASARIAVGDRARVLNIDSPSLPEDLHFDTVCAFEVLEHIENDRAALADWVKHLKPGGLLLLSVPAHSQKMGAADRLVGHFRRYDPEQMQALLAHAGLTDIRVSLYGFPAGVALEAVRNWLAQRLLAKRDTPRDYASRTAASGRLLQPGRGISGTVARAASKPMVLLQRLFPNRGPGLIASARRRS